MPVARSQTRIDAPHDEVWALISDLERGPEWSVVTLESELTSTGPVGLGSTYRAVSKFVASRITTEHEIVEWDPPHRMVSRVTKGAEAVFTQICEPAGEGTILTMVNEFVVPRGVPALVSDKLAQQVSKTLSEELSRIKKAVEETNRAAGGEGTRCS
ncbi:MAG TPA: SRPBCC family protein [Anaerolineae bacterium]|nr:SRPBCC family protein [Anaerolineae bacterium]